jgi:hypothetical protein
MCENRSWHTYAMHPALPLRNGCDTCSGGHQTVRCGAPDCLVRHLTVGPGPTWPLAIGCWFIELSGASHGASGEL